MKKKYLKATLAVAAIATVGLGSYKAYGSYMVSNMNDDNLLFSENVLALAEGGWDCMITKEQCSITASTEVSVTKLKNWFPSITLGATVDATNLTTIYAQNDGSQPKVRCGSDCNCQCLQSKFIH